MNSFLLFHQQNRFFFLLRFLVLQLKNKQFQLSQQLQTKSKYRPLFLSNHRLVTTYLLKRNKTILRFKFMVRFLDHALSVTTFLSWNNNHGEKDWLEDQRKIHVCENFMFFNVKWTVPRLMFNVCLYLRLILRGYCTPDQFCNCLCIFLKNYNTFVAGKICFI